jgi:hypothetical protein
MQTIGALFPHTLIMELPRFSRPMLMHSLSGGRDNEPVRVFAHELHHWFDIVGTRWGQRYLDTVFIAFDAVLAAESMDQAYPDVLRLFDADREILFPTYYKYVTHGAPHGTAARWINQFTAGYRIKPDGTRDQSNPILFVRLQTEDIIVARQPLSVGALLELRAMAAEDAAFRAFLPTISEDERTTEHVMRRRDILQQLYDPLLTTYSVAAHVLATSSGLPDAEPVFSWGATLADLCLNFEPSVVQKIQPPPPMRQFGHSVIHGFRSLADPGFIYVCLIVWLREQRLSALDATALNEALRGVGLPGSSDVYRQAERSMSGRQLPLPSFGAPARNPRHTAERRPFHFTRQVHFFRYAASGLLV